MSQSALYTVERCLFPESMAKGKFLAIISLLATQSFLGYLCILYVFSLLKMADRCAGCLNKYKFREKPTDCPKCRKSFCHKCLNPKKVKESGITCVYCSQKQKEANKKQNSEVLQNFHERYYKPLNQAPPIVSKIQSELQSVKVSPNLNRHAPIMLSPEDKALEERFRKLREDKVPSNPSSEEEIQKRLKKLTEVSSQKKKTNDCRDNEETSRTTDDPVDPLGRFQKTQVEQAKDLVDRAMDEVKLDKNLDTYYATHDDELSRRFDDLAGTKHPPETSELDTTAQDNVTENVVPSSHEDIDPQAVLQDLAKFQEQQERDVLQDLQSSDIQQILGQVKSVNEVEAGPPKTSGGIVKESGEVSKLIVDARKDNEVERTEQEFQKRFIEVSAKRLEDLHDDSDSDTEVKSKPKRSVGGSEHLLDFTWHHFGSDSAAAKLSGVKLESEDSFEMEGEVQQLIKQMLAESELEEKLESSGYSIEDQGKGRLEGKYTAESGSSSKLSSNAGAYTNFGQESELPWCCICNSDGVIRCHDCDDDLYCSRCFSEGHEQFGWFDHRYSLFQSSKNV